MDIKLTAYARNVNIITEDAYVNAIDHCYFARDGTGNGSVRFSHRLNLLLPKAYTASPASLPGSAINVPR